MKRILLLAIIFISTIVLFAFGKKGYDPLAITRIISENTFMDVAEVTNLNWREYMSWHAKQYGKTSKEYLASLPDVTVWEGDPSGLSAKYYLENATYNEYPVVGVSYEQAVSYCKWRATRINEVMKLQNKKNSVTYSCRLPTKVEWEKIAKIETYYFHPYKADNHNLQNVTDDGVVHERELTVPVKNFTPTLNGFYNLIGNVAELVAEKGIVKGGSWQHTNIDLQHESDYVYTKPTKWIGFRCVIERR